MASVRVCRAGELTPGSIKGFEIDGREVVVCNVEGNLYAVDDLCSHDYGTLNDGELDGYEIECPRHGARFDVRTGEATVMPAITPIDTFEVKVEGDDVEVEV